MTSESTETITIQDAVNLYIREALDRYIQRLNTVDKPKTKGKASAATNAKAMTDDEPITSPDAADDEPEVEGKSDVATDAKAKADVGIGVIAEADAADGEPEIEVKADAAMDAKSEADRKNAVDALCDFLDNRGKRKDGNRPAVLRHIQDLSPKEIDEYSNRVNGSGTTPGATEHLLVVKDFLAYVQRDLKLIDENLSRYIRVRKTRNISGAEITPTGPEKIRLTREGHEQLENQLDRLKMERETLADDIRKARADGDVSENSPLDAAREEQGRVEARIQELNATLERAVLIDETQARESKVVEVGAHVSVKPIEGGGQLDYTLVNRTEANPLGGRISDDSPMGKALLDRKVNDEVEVETPRGKKIYVIVDVS